jgi:hypothetical protein
VGVFSPIISSLSTAVAAYDFLPSERGDSSVVFVIGPVINRPDHEHSTTITTVQR